LFLSCAFTFTVTNTSNATKTNLLRFFICNNIKFVFYTICKSMT
jgi:hypothetical protein